MEKEKGSVMILTMVAVLVLSLMLTGLLTVGTTEVFTTQNYHLNKAAYYMAAQGIEEVRSLMQKTGDAQEVQGITKSTYETEEFGMGGFKKAYMTGTLRDREAGGTYGIGVPPQRLEGITMRKGSGVGLGVGKSTNFAIWKLSVTAEVNAGQKGKKVAYAELIAGVRTAIVISYSDF